MPVWVLMWSTLNSWFIIWPLKYITNFISISRTYMPTYSTLTVKGCMYYVRNVFSARSHGQPYKLSIAQPFRQKVNSAFKLKVILVLFFCRYKANVFSSKRGRTYEMLLQGGFQLLDLIITELKSHMTCQKFKVSHWWKFYLSKKLFARFALQSECCYFNQWEALNYNRSCDF